MTWVLANLDLILQLTLQHIRRLQVHQDDPGLDESVSRHVHVAHAIGRGLSELIIYGGYRTLDLSALSYQRVIENRPFLEDSVI